MKDQYKKTPPEVQINALQELIGKQFPSLYYDEFMLVDISSDRLGIDDISYRAKISIQDQIETLALTSRGWLEIFKSEDLVNKLLPRFTRLLNVLTPAKTLLLFPGEGAKVVLNLLPNEIIETFNCAQVSTERTVTNGAVEKVIISDKTKARKIISKKRITDIVVLDDVIVTTSTMTAVQEALPRRNINWYAGSLLMLSPLQNKKNALQPSGIAGYTSMLTPLLYQGTRGIPPCNSLSTLVGTTPKSEIVRPAYIEKYVEDPDTFLEAIAQIREVV